MNLFELGVIQARQALLNREFSCQEYARVLIDRTASATRLNGYVGFDPEPFLRQARQSDALLAAGSVGPELALFGVPIALKDNINTADMPTSAGTPALLGKRPNADAEIVERLKRAGAIISGKANMHELAFGISTNNAAIGAARNPWAPDSIPGGSSGGSAVVVAAGLVPAAIGTDTGASVRLPAALCGLIGLRPTVGRVSGQGIAPISSTRDTAGPMARSMADICLLDAVLTGDDTPVIAPTLRGVRLGFPTERFWDALDASVSEAMDNALQALRSAGVVIVDVSLPKLSELNDAVGFPVALYEFLEEMPGYLRASGHAIDVERLIEGVASPDVAQILRPLLGSGAIPQAAYHAALQARRELQALYRTTFEQNGLQALIFPTSALTTRPIGPNDTVDVDGVRVPAFPAYIRNTDPGSNAGIPGISLPAGNGRSGLPVGLALDAPAGTDRSLLALATAIEAVLPPVRLPALT